MYRIVAKKVHPKASLLLVFFAALFGVVVLYLNVADITTTAPTTTVLKKGTEQNKNELPHRLVLHIGPPKTASTTIQCAMRGMEELLIEDRYHVLETDSCRPPPRARDEQQEGLQRTRGGAQTYDNVVLGASYLPPCLAGGDSGEQDEEGLPLCWKESYLRLIEEKLSNGTTQHFVLSNEILLQTIVRKLHTRPQPLASIFRSLQVRGIGVHLVAGYRPFFEYLGSTLFQKHNHNIASRPRRYKWLANGGTPIPSFEEYYQNHESGKAPVWTFTDEAPVKELKKLPGVTSFRILDIYDQDVTTNFFCNYVLEANKTCAKLLQNNQRHSSSADRNDNAGNTNFHYDHIVTGAEKAGMINISTILYSRIDMGKRAIWFWTEQLGLTYKDLPKQCPSAESLSRLYEESLARERSVFAGLLSATPNDTILEEKGVRHQANFDRYKSEERFCHPDSSIILADPRWKDFFLQAHEKEKEQ